ncbi:hypothetical protein [Sphingomonas sp.]|uniref:hypothetical protein n=1 Tax=Sphingomonas sp. TaxID=28214 RepID=UPI002DD68027|nr:hypothetical protein [Sphingomonas sp.]
MKRCARRQGGAFEEAYRQCIGYSAPRVFTGIYLDAFEGQQFIEGAATDPPYIEPDRKIWMNVALLPATDRIRQVQELQADATQIWTVEFVGRVSTAPGFFGHMGVYDGEVIADRIISARLLKTVDGYVGPDLPVRNEQP